jgi:transcriptional regulator with XRE-family HTH domain
MSSDLLERVRHDAGLSQEELAVRAGTSRTTLSAYERGRKSPTLAAVSRLIDTAGYELSAEPRVAFTETVLRRGRPIYVANRLWRLPVKNALADVMLPLSVNWSRPGAVFRLSNRRERSRCYEIVLREGMPADIRRVIDGALLVDVWSELVLPREVRDAWRDVVEEVAA